jgi:hypothetical protein
MERGLVHQKEGRKLLVQGHIREQGPALAQGEHEGREGKLGPIRQEDLPQLAPVHLSLLAHRRLEAAHRRRSCGLPKRAKVVGQHGVMPRVAPAPKLAKQHGCVPQAGREPLIKEGFERLQQPKPLGTCRVAGDAPLLEVLANGLSVIAGYRGDLAQGETLPLHLSNVFHLGTS